MVALLDKSPLPSKTALRARGATSRFHSRRATAVKSRNYTEIRHFTYDACDRSGSCSNDGNSSEMSKAYRRMDSNFYGYVRNAPSNHLDPSGNVLIVPIADNTRTANKCPEPGNQRQIGAVWSFRRSPNGRKCAGWIVQEIKIFCSKTPCSPFANCPTTGDGATFPSRPSTVFYEAWHVPEGSDRTDEETPPAGKVDYTDASTPVIADETCGQYYAVGTVKFFCDTDRNGQLRNKLPGTWRYGAKYLLGNCGAVETGPEIPSTQQVPGWWSDSEESLASRVNSLSWTCCKCKKPRFVDVYTFPIKD